MKPTLQQIFGPNAALDVDTLNIEQADFSALGWTSTANLTDAEKWLVALLLRWQSWYGANTSEDQNVAIDAPFRGLILRDGTNKREYSFTIRVYEPDTGAALPDPDNV